MVTIFQPWIGTFNPNDQQVNEYIRQLKEELSAPVSASSGVESGTWTGDGGASKEVALSNTVLTPKLIIKSVTATPYNAAFWFDSLGDDVITIESGVTISLTSGIVTAVAAGSFTCTGTGTVTGWNQSSRAYYYFILGDIS